MADITDGQSSNDYNLSLYLDTATSDIGEGLEKTLKMLHSFLSTEVSYLIGNWNDSYNTYFV